MKNSEFLISVSLQRERLAREHMIAEQNAAYEKSLEVDREKRKRKEQQKLQEEEERQEREVTHTHRTLSLSLYVYYLWSHRLSGRVWRVCYLKSHLLTVQRS